MSGTAISYPSTFDNNSLGLEVAEEELAARRKRRGVPRLKTEKASSASTPHWRPTHHPAHCGVRRIHGVLASAGRSSPTTSPARAVLGSVPPARAGREASLGEGLCKGGSRGKVAAVVVDTDTRFLPSQEAYDRVYRKTGELRLKGARWFFKKIDSTLRGNPAEETAAVMDAAGYRFAIVAPSAPRNKRTVLEGICYVAGQPVADTAMGRDPFTPVTESSVVRIMEKRFPGEVAHLDIHVVRSGIGSLPRKRAGRPVRRAPRVRRRRRNHGGLEIPRIAFNDRRRTFVGSSGLAEAVAKQACLREPGIAEHPDGKDLFIIGSITPTSKAQCDALAQTPRRRRDNRRSLGHIVRSRRRVASDPRRLSSASRKCAILLRTGEAIRSGVPGFEGEGSSGARRFRFLGDLSLEIAALRGTRVPFRLGGRLRGPDSLALGRGMHGISFPNFFRGRFGSLPGPVVFNKRIYFASKAGDSATRTPWPRACPRSPLPESRITRSKSFRKAQRRNCSE
ncbi:MAG: four-carbon acid sugar kinase family protein [Marinilabiliales bacterium]|nr:four-carbon acid sugar kinase family protein [Marinilabiliales bacterium]